MRIIPSRIFQSPISQHRTFTVGFRRFASTRPAAGRSATAAITQRRRLNSTFATERAAEREDSVLFGKHASSHFGSGESFVLGSKHFLTEPQLRQLHKHLCNSTERSSNQGLYEQTSIKLE